MTETQTWKEKLQATLQQKKANHVARKEERAKEREKEKENDPIFTVLDAKKAKLNKRYDERTRWEERIHAHTVITRLLVDKSTGKVNGAALDSYVVITFTANGVAFLEKRRTPGGAVKAVGLAEFYDTDDYCLVGMEHLTDISDKGKSLGRAVTGGLFFGPTGAIIGAAAAKNKIIDQSQMVFLLQNVRTKDLTEYLVPCTKTEFINTYRSIPVHPLLGQKERTVGEAVSVADELLKLKGLMEDGLLTQEEFIAMKEKMLEKA